MTFSSLKRFSPLALASSSPGQWRWCGDTNSNRLFFLGAGEEGEVEKRLTAYCDDHCIGSGQELDGVHSLSKHSVLAWEEPIPMGLCLPSI